MSVILKIVVLFTNTKLHNDVPWHITCIEKEKNGGPTANLSSP